MSTSSSGSPQRNQPRSRRPAASARKRTRRLALEKLEPRQLLAATDLAAIAGRVFRDATGDGFTPGEQVVGATLNLFRNVNANGTLDAGDGGALRSATSDSNGQYSFDRLSAGDYFVQQPAQTVSGASLIQITSSRISISSTDVQGTPGRVIDGFTTRQTVTAPLPVGTTIVSAQNAAEAIGGERDMSVTLTAGQTGDFVTLEAGSGLLSINAGFNASGRYVVSWDGQDNNASSLNPIGLRTGGNGVDLTAGGVNSYIELAGAGRKSRRHGPHPRLYRRQQFLSGDDHAGLEFRAKPVAVVDLGFYAGRWQRCELCQRRRDRTPGRHDHGGSGRSALHASHGRLQDVPCGLQQPAGRRSVLGQNDQQPQCRCRPDDLLYAEPAELGPRLRDQRDDHRSAANGPDVCQRHGFPRFLQQRQRHLDRGERTCQYDGHPASDDHGRGNDRHHQHGPGFGLRPARSRLDAQ